MGYYMEHNRNITISDMYLINLSREALIAGLVLYSIIGLLYLWRLYRTQERGYLFCLGTILLQCSEFAVLISPRRNTLQLQPIIMSALLSIPVFYGARWIRSMEGHIKYESLRKALIASIVWLILYQKLTIIIITALLILSYPINATLAYNWTIAGMVCHAILLLGLLFNTCLCIWYLIALPQSIPVIYGMKLAQALSLLILNVILFISMTVMMTRIASYAAFFYFLFFIPPLTQQMSFQYYTMTVDPSEPEAIIIDKR
ncbi:hypothetical protein BDF22DRAFT_774367 [Syncephalis plumigaleata]|nr:hypothetical protein BDF22DRAFT_774367 [Syncephalis plumigaleata]